MMSVSEIKDLSAWRSRLMARRLELLDVFWIGKQWGWPIPSVRWEKGCYLHLMFSLPSGRRDFYVGSDPEYVTMALKGLMAQKELDAITRKLFSIDKVESEIENSLQELEYSLEV